MERRIELTLKQSKKLQRLPEQGMGYQLVDLILKSGKVMRNQIVLNTSLLILTEGDALDPDEIMSIELSPKT